MSTVDHRQTVANRKINASPTFAWFKWESIGDGVMLTGSETNGVVTRGARKGRPRYVGERIRAFVTDAEERQEHARYEAETGNCGNCGGDGKAFAGWSAAEGTRWGACRRCGGTGTVADAMLREREK